MTNGTKRCSKCREIKPLSAFSKASREKSGYQSACKACRKSLYQAAQNERNKLRYADDPQYREKKRASVVASFDKNKDRYYAKRVEKYAKNKSFRHSVIEYIKKWQAENNHRIRVYSARRRAKDVGADGDFTADDVKQLLEKQQAKCIYCGENISGRLYTIEHLTPLSRGGSNDVENIALACRSCNARKGDKLVTEFFKT